MLTQAEKTFIARMAPHVMSGKSMEDAARAVLADDERLWLIATNKDEIGGEIRGRMAAAVYNRIRSAA